MPRLTINLFSGGKHAGEQVPVQDTLIVPLSSTTVDETLVIAYDIYQAAAELTRSRYSMRLLRADEGGLAPPSRKVEEMRETAVESITRAGYRPGKDVALAIDVAASHFYRDGLYWLGEAGLPAEAMIAQTSNHTLCKPIL